MFICTYFTHAHTQHSTHTHTFCIIPAKFESTAEATNAYLHTLNSCCTGATAFQKGEQLPPVKIEKIKSKNHNALVQLLYSRIESGAARFI